MPFDAQLGADDVSTWGLIVLSSSKDENFVTTCLSSDYEWLTTALT